MAEQRSCLEAALRFLEGRAHSRAELGRKLKRKKWSDEAIGEALAKLERLGHINDERFAQMRAASAAKHKHHGPNRVMSDLMRAGVSMEFARGAVKQVYSKEETAGLARDLAMKQVRRLAKLDPVVARRRLIGALQRRGFDYDTINTAVGEAMGRGDEE